MKTLEQRADAEKRMNSAFKGAAIYTAVAVTGELIGSKLLMGAGIGGLLADVGLVTYYGIRHREYFGRNQERDPNNSKQ